jgi:hypothetical protein
LIATRRRPVNDRPISHAAGTIAGVLTDLHELSMRLGAGKPMDAHEAEFAARILDRLSEELAEAAADVRKAPGPLRPGGESPLSHPSPTVQDMREIFFPEDPEGKQR